MQPEKTRKRFGNWVFRSPNNRIRLRGDRNEEVKTQNVFFSRIPAFFSSGELERAAIFGIDPPPPLWRIEGSGIPLYSSLFLPRPKPPKGRKRKEKKHHFFGSFPVAAQITFPFSPPPFVTNDAGHSKKFRKNRKHNPISLTPRPIIAQQRIVQYNSPVFIPWRRNDATFPFCV